MLKDILVLLAVAAVMLGVGLSLRKLDRLLREGKAARRRGYRTPPRCYDHREDGPEQLKGKRQGSSRGFFGSFLLK